MLLQLLFYYGALQTVHNLLRFLQIDSEVFRCGTPGEPFNRAQGNRGLPTHSNMMFQRMLPPGWTYASANHIGGIPVKTPRFFPVSN